MAKKKADSMEQTKPKVSRKEFISGLKTKEIKREEGVKLISSRKPKIVIKERVKRPEQLAQITKKERDYLEVTFNEIDHGILSLLKERLNVKDEVLECGYYIEHPVIGKPVFKLRTKGKEALDVWNQTVEEVLKELSEFKTAVVKVK